jgi:HSP20 family protein
MTRIPVLFNYKDDFITSIDRLFDELMADNFPSMKKRYGGNLLSKGAYPKCDIKNYADKMEIVAAIPGLTKKEIDIKVKDEVLSLSANKHHYEEEKDGTEFEYIYRELKRSAFTRSFTLGDNLDHKTISAKFDPTGLLTISVSKINHDDPPEGRKIKID